MTNEDIDFLVRGIDSRTSATDAALSELNDQPDDRVKINCLIELLAQGSGELAFIKEQLLKEKKPIRKFAILMK